MSLRTATPVGYAVVDAARQVRTGGGIAVMYRSHYKCANVVIPQSTTFESVCVSLSTASGSFVLLTIYRPGSRKVTGEFFDELAAVLEILVLQSCPVIVGGDLNVRTDADTARLTDMLTAFGMVQRVTGPTHRLGGLLDVVITRDDYVPTDVCVDAPDVVSDHALVTCRLPITSQPPPVQTRRVRSWRSVDRRLLCDAIANSSLYEPLSPSPDVDEMFANYDAVLRDIADRFAPEHDVRFRPRPLSPWFDADCHVSRRNCRRLERRYRRSRSDSDRRAYVAAAQSKLKLFQAKRDAYWLARAREDGPTGKLWRTLNSVLGRNQSAGERSTTLSADGFADSFSKKVSDIRAATDGSPPPDIRTSATTSMSVFQPVTEADVRRVIMKSPSKSSSLDPIPTYLLKEVVDSLLPYITALVNASLQQGRLPTSQKHAIVTPRLKKPGADTADMANYRPVSNLSFLSKTVERVVAEQLNSYLMVNGLMPPLQSAFRRHHSTETALLRVMADVFAAADQQRVTLLALLDLSAAFDCVDHDILLMRLQRSFGLSGCVIDWIRSFLADRTQRVAYAGGCSRLVCLLWGVPQGSVLGPLLFLLYAAELFDVVAAHEASAHFYADDGQLYVNSLAVDADVATSQLTACVADVDAWMKANRLRLNAQKTQLIWLGSGQQLEKITATDVQFLSANIQVMSTVRDLGVLIDSRLTMADHVTAICRSAYYQLRQLRCVVQLLTSEAAMTLVHSFISTRLDYCNSVLYGIADNQLQRLQSVQNAAARLVTGTRRTEHITPVLQSLHWLPVRQRIVYKLATLVYKCLTGRAPAYLAEYCRQAGTRRPGMRSAGTSTLDVPRTRTALCDRSFAVAGPRIWNSLPASIRDPTLSAGTFAALLKTYLFV